MPKEHQIGAYLTKPEADRLAGRSRGHEISRPKLCALLVLRELSCSRIPVLAKSFGGSEPKSGAKRVVARVSEPTKKAFEAHAAAHSMGIDDAAAVVFRAELDEDWLHDALRRCEPGNRS